MIARLYKMQCLTNLHMGAGGGSYSIIDNEVEKDHNGYPIMHASGIKGALRDSVSDNEIATYIFGRAANKDGDDTKGHYIFTDGCMLARTMRVCGNQSFASLPTTTPEMLRHFLQLTEAFGCCPVSNAQLPEKDREWGFGNNNFLCNVPDARIEDEPTGKFIDNGNLNDLLQALIGPHFAIARQLGDDYPLPTVARNCLGEDKNLWYEEFVPYGSRFYTIILTPNDEKNIQLDFSAPLQFGANASIGRGFISISEWERKD